MWILPLVGYSGAIIGFGFLTLAIACGLYYLSELVEEHTVMAKRLLTRLIYTIVGVQIALWLVDGFPFWSTALGIVAHIVYLGNLRRFPFVKLSDPLFLLACVLVLADHFVWFSHFSSSQMSAYHRQSYYERFEGPNFTMTASYFGLCVWFVPFSLFVSLSASDNVLPTMRTEPVRGFDGKSRHQGMVKTLVDYVRGTIGQIASSSGVDRP
uniref:Protein TEX261 n=1 Tax=Nilaparvata lugens TaxID=108931 RepID=A0A1L2K1M7_NILLU|nr:seven up [Nilaparvata lugens]